MIDNVQIPNICWPELGRHICVRFDDDKAGRYMQEILWLRDLRQVRGVLDPEIEKAINAQGWGSKAFIRTTRTKVRTNDARINDIAFNQARQNWSFDIPENPQIPGMEQSSLEDVKKAAEIAVKAEMKVVKDLLTRAKYNKKGRKITHSGHQYGTGVSYGPLPDNETIFTWIPTPQPPPIQLPTQEELAAGVMPPEGPPPAPQDPWQCSEQQRLSLHMDWVPVWDHYCENGARSMEESDHDIRRRIMGKGDLQKMMSREDMDTEVIRAHMRAHPSGDYVRLDWEQKMNHEDTKNERNLPKESVRYEVLEWWGLIDRDLLIQHMAPTIPEGWDQLPDVVEVNCWLFAKTKQVFKAVFNPILKQWRPFDYYIPDPEEGQPYGNSVPYLVRDTQLLRNATTQGMMNNLAAASGPQIDVDKDRLADADSLVDFSPFTVHFTRSEAWHQNRKAIEFYQPQMYAPQYIQSLSVIDKYEDEASASPSYQSGLGAGGAGRTARGLGMLMGNSDLLMLEQNNSCDDFQISFLEKVHDWIMQFWPDQSIKGNWHVKVIPSQSQSLMDEESQRLENFAGTTANPLDAPWVHRRRLLKARARAMRVAEDDVLKTDKELQDEMEAMQNGQPPATPGADATKGPPPAAGAGPQDLPPPQPNGPPATGQAPVADDAAAHQSQTGAVPHVG